MKDIRARLVQLPGVNGALLVSDDGLLIAAHSKLGGKEAEETVSALAGRLGRSAASAVEKLQLGRLKTVMLSGIGGRTMLTRAGSAFLVALVDSDCNIGLIQLELGGAANEAARSISL